MKKRNLFLILIMLLAFIFVAGCSSVPKEKDIKEDLIHCADKKLLSDGETLESVEITDRTTDKKQKMDSILCEVTTHKGDVSYEKGVKITYYKYDKGWEIGNITVSDSDSWLVKPLKGVSDATIKDKLTEQTVKVDGEDWRIESGEIKNLTVDDRKTDLENKKDEVSITVTLDSGIEKATGTLTADFEFDNSWKLVSCQSNNDFKVSTEQGKAMNMTEDSLLALLSEQPLSFDKNSAHKQDITITKDGVSDFKIDSQKVSDKGTLQEYESSCKFTKSNAVFNVTFTTQCSYENEWTSTIMDSNLQLESVDWAGKWTGRYLDAPYSGNVVLELAVNGNQVTGTYSYTPDTINTFSGAGSYNVSGTINEGTLNINLTAGDWITKPNHALSYEKQDINAYLNINDGTIEGQGHNGDTFTMSK